MDVRRTAGIGDGFDRAKVVPPLGVGDNAAVALERRVATLAAGLTRMVINTLRVALPDLDEGAGKRPTIDADHAALEMKHLAHGMCLSAADLDEVVVHVGGKARRIERPFGLPRCRDRARGEGGRQRQQASANAGAGEQATAGEDRGRCHPMQSANRKRQL